MANYPDFNTAWADWNTWIKADVEDSWLYADTALGNASLEGFTDLGFAYLWDAVAYTLYMIFSHAMQLDGLYEDSAHSACVYKAWSEAGATDMDGIINAMLAAKSEEITKFIGLEQAFMAAIWNAPYNHEYYSALARGFRKWG